MNKQKKRIIVCLSLLFLLGGVVLFTVQFIRVNQQFPPAIQKQYELMTPVPYQQVSITAEKFEILGHEDLLSRDSRYESDGYDTSWAPGTYRILTAGVTIHNNTGSVQIIDFTRMTLQSEAWHNGLYLEYFNYLNKDVPNLSISQMKLPPKGDVRVVLPFLILDIHVPKNSWEHLDQRAYELILSLYPEKTVIRLN